MSGKMFSISLFYYLSHVMIVLYNGLCVGNLLQFGGLDYHVSSSILSSTPPPMTMGGPWFSPLLSAWVPCVESENKSWLSPLPHCPHIQSPSPQFHFNLANTSHIRSFHFTFMPSWVRQWSLTALCLCSFLCFSMVQPDWSHQNANIIISTSLLKLLQGSPFYLG